MITYIAIGIIIICLLGILYITIRKLPEIATIDVSTIPEEKEAAIKHKILKDRFSRKTHKQINTVIKSVNPFWRFVQKNFRGLYQYVVDLERKYRRKYRPLLTKEDLAHNIEDLLKKAEDFKGLGNYASAEKQYIEIISLDGKNYQAYKGLADLYYTKKEYKQAEEVYNYLIKLNLLEQKKFEEVGDTEGNEIYSGYQKDLADVYVSYGNLFSDMGNYESAYDTYQLAVDLEPNNPRLINLILDVAIRLGKKSQAIDLFNMLKKVNPDNKKLDELGQRIKDMKL